LSQRAPRPFVSAHVCVMSTATTMARIFRKLPSAGESVAIAFSGGLDTRCAVAWLKNKGLKVHAYTADLAQPDEKDVRDIPKEALRHGAVNARVLDCKEAMA